MTKKLEKPFSLNKDCREFYDLNYDNRYEVLRNWTQIKFLDYNLIQVIRTFHIKDNFSNLTNSNIYNIFFALPEQYDIKTVLTHNLQIFLNDVKMDIMESDNKVLNKLNNCNRIFQTKEYFKKF